MRGMPTRVFRCGAPVLAVPLLFLLGLQPPPAGSAGPAPIVYTLSVPEPRQRWMQVEIEFPSVDGPLDLRMSRTSPGRYSLHEFAKNVYDVTASGAGGGASAVRQIAPHAWEAPGQGGPLHVRYKVFGDRIDGTYLAIDETHAHVNAPAALMWAVGRELDPVVVRVVPPPGLGWRVATQLVATGDPFVFTAPNRHYLIDSPLEISAHARHTFVADPPPGSDAAPPAVVVALHHAGGPEDAGPYLDGLRRIVREQASIFGEYPAFEGQTFTFLADYLPWADADGMEHRNSAVLTDSVPLATSAISLLAGASHEFFHAWNVERIRPRGLEPFDLLDANVTGELWLAEGFTTYYETLTMVRAGVMGLDEGLRVFGDRLSRVLTSTAHRYRSADEMSRMALLWDRATRADRTNLDDTFLSYYVHGASLGLGVDLLLRDRSGGARSLDDFMRAMWEAHGRTPGGVAGLVASPYTLADVRRRLADVSGDERLASELVDRFVLGREVMDYERLVALAGLRLRPAAPGRASLGTLALEERSDRVYLAAPPPPGSAAALAGLGQDDAILALEQRPIRRSADLAYALGRHRAGDEVTVRVLARPGTGPREVRVKLEPMSGYELVTLEATGEQPDPAQRAFREQWLSSRFR